MTEASELVKRLRNVRWIAPNTSEKQAEVVCLEAASLIESQEDEIRRLREALEWYADHVCWCRKITSEGDTARNALDRDGGAIARSALQQKE